MFCNARSEVFFHWLASRGSHLGEGGEKSADLHWEIVCWKLKPKLSNVPTVICLKQVPGGVNHALVSNIWCERMYDLLKVNLWNFCVGMILLRIEIWHLISVSAALMLMGYGFLNLHSSLIFSIWILDIYNKDKS